MERLKNSKQSRGARKKPGKAKGEGAKHGTMVQHHPSKWTWAGFKNVALKQMAKEAKVYGAFVLGDAPGDTEENLKKATAEHVSVVVDVCACSYTFAHCAKS